MKNVTNQNLKRRESLWQKFKYVYTGREPKLRLLSQCPLKLRLLSNALYIILTSSIHALTYQQRQDFALVLVIRRHRDVPAFLSAKGDAAAIRAPDRRS